MTLFNFDLEEKTQNGYDFIIGTDEAGRGPGAGGVFAAAVYFDKITDGLISDLAILNFSLCSITSVHKTTYKSSVFHIPCASYN